MAQRLAASRVVAKSQTGTDAGFVLAEPEHAGLGRRVIAYLIDSVVLFGFALVFFAAAGLNIYLRSDAGRENPSDAAFWDFQFIIIATVPVWLLLGLFLDLRRGQSTGQYVVGLRVVRTDGRPVGPARHLLHWLAFHPLLFHPLLAGTWLLIAFIGGVTLSESKLLYLGSLTVAVLCVLAPIAGFFFALGDSQRRGLHDWIAGTKVVRVE